jgi:hypothetical protein
MNKPKKVVKNPEKKTQNTKVKRDEWTPTNKMQLKHKIQGRSVFVAKFKPLKTFEFDEVVNFVKGMRKNLMGGDVKTIQIGFELSNNQFYSGKMTNIDDDLDVNDYRNLYDGEYQLLGFSIYLS